MDNTYENNKILLVQDNYEMRKLIIYLLSRDNIQVDELENGLKFYKKLSKQENIGNYDLVIFDYKIPGINNAEMLEKYLNSVLKKNILPPVLMLTPFPDNFSKEKIELLNKNIELFYMPMNIFVLIDKIKSKLNIKEINKTKPKIIIENRDRISLVNIILNDFNKKQESLLKRKIMKSIDDKFSAHTDLIDYLYIKITRFTNEKVINYIFNIDVGLKNGDVIYYDYETGKRNRDLINILLMIFDIISLKLNMIMKNNNY